MIFDIEVAKDVGTDAAIILSNIEFWQSKNMANKKHFHNDRYWTYNSVSAWCKLFPYLSNAQIRRCLEKLKKGGYIITNNFNNSSYDRTKWYSSNRQIHLSELANGIDKNDKPIPDVNTINKLNNIEERKAEFKKEVAEHLGQKYDASLCGDFFNYWSEHGPNDKKMRFEKEKTFGVYQRMHTFWRFRQERKAKVKTDRL